MSNPRIIYVPRANITLEQARDARTRAWAFVFECWDKKKGDHHVVTRSESSNKENEITGNGTGEN